MSKTTSNAFVVAALGMCLSVFSSLPAEAACTQADATGTWHVMGFSVDSNLGGVEWDRCKIRASSTGSIVASASSCVFRYSGGKYSANVSSGSIRVGAACNVSGSVRVCISGSGCVSLRIEYGQLDRGKTVMSFVGNIVESPSSLYSFTGIKQ